MSYTVEILTKVNVKDSTGKPVTESMGGVTRRISASGEEIYRVTATVADAYTKVTLWDSGDGGVDDFDALVLISDKAVLLELVEDATGTPLYSTFSIAANVPFVLSTDDVMNVAATNGVQSTTDTIDSVRVQNNAADEAGDATVVLLLVS